MHIPEEEIHYHTHADGTVHAHTHAHTHTQTKSVINRLSRAIGHLESPSSAWSRAGATAARF